MDLYIQERDKQNEQGKSKDNKREFIQFKDLYMLKNLVGCSVQFKVKKFKGI